MDVSLLDTVPPELIALIAPQPEWVRYKNYSDSHTIWRYLFGELYGRIPKDKPFIGIYTDLYKAGRRSNKELAGIYIKYGLDDLFKELFDRMQWLSEDISSLLRECVIHGNLNMLKYITSTLTPPRNITEYYPYMKEYAIKHYSTDEMFEYMKEEANITIDNKFFEKVDYRLTPYFIKNNILPSPRDMRVMIVLYALNNNEKEFRDNIEMVFKGLFSSDGDNLNFVIRNIIQKADKESYGHLYKYFIMIWETFKQSIKKMIPDRFQSRFEESTVNELSIYLSERKLYDDYTENIMKKYIDEYEKIIRKIFLFYISIEDIVTAEKILQVKTDRFKIDGEILNSAIRTGKLDVYNYVVLKTDILDLSNLDYDDAINNALESGNVEMMIFIFQLNSPMPTFIPTIDNILHPKRRKHVKHIDTLIAIINYTINNSPRESLNFDELLLNFPAFGKNIINESNKLLTHILKYVRPTIDIYLLIQKFYRNGDKESVIDLLPYVTQKDRYENFTKDVKPISHIKRFKELYPDIYQIIKTFKNNHFKRFKGTNLPHEQMSSIITDIAASVMSRD